MATKKTTTTSSAKAKKDSIKKSDKAALAPEKKVSKSKKAVSLDVSVYSTEGKEAGSIKLPENIFGLPWNADLVHQVMTSMRTSARTPVAHVKTRGEVRGGGKKPWKQKGTGRARHGSSRSPIWVGGGVTHGPRADKNFDRKINKKMKTKALFTILSQKLRDGEVLFVKELSFAAPKTAVARTILNKLGTVSGYEMLAQRRNNAAIIATATNDANVKRSFNNFGNIEVTEMRNINPLALLQYKYVVVASPEETIKTLEAKITK